MGASLVGRAPTAPVGEEFFQSYFRFVPLLLLVEDICGIDDEWCDDGLNADRARLIGRSLEEHLERGAFENYVRAGRHQVLMRQFLQKSHYPGIEQEMPEPPNKERVATFAAFLQSCGGYDLH